MAGLTQLDREYSQLMELFYDVVDSEAGHEVAEDAAWLQDAEDLAVKLFNHLGTIRYLWDGTNLPIIDGRPRQYVDHSSITVLLRAAFETYLCYYYIYADLGCSAETRKLRHDIWSLGGLLDRQNATSSADRGIPVFQRDKQVIARLLSDIEDNPAFRTLASKYQKKAKNGIWRLDKSWADLAELAGFDKTFQRTSVNWRRRWAQVYRYVRGREAEKTIGHRQRHRNSLTTSMRPYKQPP